MIATQLWTILKQHQNKISYPIRECPTYVLFLCKSSINNFRYKNGNYEKLELIKITRWEFFVLALIKALIEALGR